MLDEAIDYLKSLQLQLQVLNDIISYAQVGYFSYLPLLHPFLFLFIQPPDLTGAIVV